MVVIRIYYNYFVFVFKLMMEVTLVTKCDFYEDSWSKILPQLWQYTTENNLKALEDQGLMEEDFGNMDAGTSYNVTLNL